MVIIDGSENVRINLIKKKIHFFIIYSLCVNLIYSMSVNQKCTSSYEYDFVEDIKTNIFRRLLQKVNAVSSYIINNFFTAETAIWVGFE